MLHVTQLLGFGGDAQFPGPELIVNGGFAADTDWTKGSGWAIAAGVATHTAGSGGNLAQALAFIVGGVYRTEFTLSGYTAGNFFVRFSGSGADVDGSLRTANGTYTQDLTAVTGNDTFNIVGTSAGAGSVDNVSCYRIA